MLKRQKMVLLVVLLFSVVVSACNLATPPQPRNDELTPITFCVGNCNWAIATHTPSAPIEPVADPALESSGCPITPPPGAVSYTLQADNGSYDTSLPKVRVSADTQVTVPDKFYIVFWDANEGFVGISAQCNIADSSSSVAAPPVPQSVPTQPAMIDYGNPPDCNDPFWENYPEVCPSQPSS